MSAGVPRERRLSAAAALALSTALVVGGVIAPLVLDGSGTPSAAPGTPSAAPGTPPPAPSLVVADVAVYGATASGVIAAVSAANAGASVVLLEPSSHVGGMVTSGLGLTDAARKDLVGGLTLDFHARVGRYYGMRRAGQFISWNHEPHVAAGVFRDMLDEAGVRVLLGQRLDRAAGVIQRGGRIQQIRTQSGTTVEAAVFIDSTYEGDLLAAAGVSYTVGREAHETYRELLGGVRSVVPAKTDVEKVLGRSSENGEPLLGVSIEPLGPWGSADARIQPYTFRLCVTDVPANRVPFEQPTGYDPARYSLTKEAIRTWTERLGKAPPLSYLMTIAALPHGKGDLNSAGLFSTDYVGGSYDWPEADDATRDLLWQEHREYVAGLLYFFRTDKDVPVELRAEVDRWGLCKDEFTDTGNWPPQLYVREARRMVGEVVLNQGDVQEGRVRQDSIGVGAYAIDVHAIRRVLDASGYVRPEGQLYIPAEPYEIPLAILLPKRGEVDNLVVSVAVSASHVAWGSLRMEPQLMTMGEAAGVVAAIAADRSLAVQDVPYSDVAEILRSRGGIFRLP